MSNCTAGAFLYGLILVQPPSVFSLERHTLTAEQQPRFNNIRNVAVFVFHRHIVADKSE